MKKLLSLALALIMLLSCAVPALAATTINPDQLDYPVGTPANKENNPVIEGEHPFTGLKAETDEERDAVLDKMAEVKRNAQSVYCSKNPGCPRKKAEVKVETKKIELD